MLAVNGITAYNFARVSRANTMTLDEFYKICDAIVPDEYGCHNWPKACPGFYGRTQIDTKSYYVHRLALERKIGRPITSGLFALHACDWKPCVNPDHLYEGTYRDNMLDALERNPEYRAQVTLKSDPEYRAKRLEVLRRGNETVRAKYHNDPEFRAKMDKNLAIGHLPKRKRP
jgi:hypothetical protein